MRGKGYSEFLHPRAARSRACPGLTYSAPIGQKTRSASGFQEPMCVQPPDLSVKIIWTGEGSAFFRACCYSRRLVSGSGD